MGGSLRACQLETSGKSSPSDLTRNRRPWHVRLLDAGADPGFFAGGGGQRRPCTAGAFGARADGGSRVDKHQIKVHSVHRIFRAIFFFFC